MFDRVTLKTRAKNVLAKSYLIILVACFIRNLLSGGGLGIWGNKIYSLNPQTMSDARLIAAATVAAALLLISIGVGIFVSGPVESGLKRLILRASEGDVNLSYLFSAFKENYKNAVIVKLMKTLIIFVWSLLSFIPLAVGIARFGLVGTLDRKSVV